jgi:hypothetical protein
VPRRRYAAAKTGTYRLKFGIEALHQFEAHITTSYFEASSTGKRLEPLVFVKVGLKARMIGLKHAASGLTTGRAITDAARQPSETAEGAFPGVWKRGIGREDSTAESFRKFDPGINGRT